MESRDCEGLQRNLEVIWGRMKCASPGVDGTVTEDLVEKIRLIKWESLGV